MFFKLATYTPLRHRWTSRVRALIAPPQTQTVLQGRNPVLKLTIVSHLKLERTFFVVGLSLFLREIRTCTDWKLCCHPVVTIAVDGPSSQKSEAGKAFVPDNHQFSYIWSLSLVVDPPVDTVLELGHPPPIPVLNGGQVLLRTSHQGGAHRQGRLAPHPRPALHPRLP